MRPLVRLVPVSYLWCSLLLGLGLGAAGTTEEGRKPRADSAKPLEEVAGRRHGCPHPGGVGTWKSFPQVTADECWHGSLGGGGISYLNVCPKAELSSHVSGVAFTVSTVRAAYPASADDSVSLHCQK